MSTCFRDIRGHMAFRGLETDTLPPLVSHLEALKILPPNGEKKRPVRIIDLPSRKISRLLAAPTPRYLPRTKTRTQLA